VGPALLVLEFNSVAGGIYISDLLVKQAEVKILDSRTVCPGKYMVTLTGDVDALKSSLEAARESDLGETITEQYLFPNVHAGVLAAIHEVPDYAALRSIGVIETYGIPACVRAADAGAKAAAVEVVEMRLADAQGGKCVVAFSGEQHDIEVSLGAGSAVAEEMKGLIKAIIVERPHESLARFLES
jgi:microcompartment protein CcmL/EutN